jgi:hypothetical protein
MTALVLGAIAFAALVLSFKLVALTICRVIPNPPGTETSKSQARQEDEGGVSATMSRVIGDVERLAALRDRGALTDAEFKAEKTKLLRVAPSEAAKAQDRPARGGT